MLFFVFLSLLAYHFHRGEAYCTAVLGSGIAVRDCLRARAAIFTPSLMHVSERDFITITQFGLYHPSSHASLPIGGKFGTCALGIDIAAGHGTTVAVSYLHLYQRALQLVSACVEYGGGTGGIIDDGDETGVVFVLVNPRQVNVIQSCMSSAQSGRMDLRQCMLERGLAVGQGFRTPPMPPAPYHAAVVEMQPQPMPIPHAPHPQSSHNGGVRYRPGEPPVRLSGAWNAGQGVWVPATLIVSQWLDTAGWLLLKGQSFSTTDLPFPDQTSLVILGGVWLSRGGQVHQLAGAWIAHGRSWEPLGGELDVDRVPPNRWVLLLGLSQEVMAQQGIVQQAAIQRAGNQGANIQEAPVHLGQPAQRILIRLPGHAPARQTPAEDETSSTARQVTADSSPPFTELRTIESPQEQGIPVRLVHGDVLNLAGIWERRRGAWHALGPGRHPIWGQTHWWLLLRGTGPVLPVEGKIPGPQGRTFFETYPGQRIQLTGAWLMQGGPWQAVTGNQPAGGPWTTHSGWMLLQGEGAPPKVILLPTGTGSLPPAPEVTLPPAGSEVSLPLAGSGSLPPAQASVAPIPPQLPLAPAQVAHPLHQPQPQPAGNAAGAAQAGAPPNIQPPQSFTAWDAPQYLGGPTRLFNTYGMQRVVAGIWLRRGGQWVPSRGDLIDAAWRAEGCWFVVLGRGLLVDRFPGYVPPPPETVAIGNVVGLWLSQDGVWQFRAASPIEDWWRRGKWFLGKMADEATATASN